MGVTPASPPCTTLPTLTPERETNRTLMYGGCAGCVGAAVLFLAGGALAFYGFLSGLSVLTIAGVAVVVAAIAVGVVSGIVNNLGFGKDLANRIQGRNR